MIAKKKKVAAKKATPKKTTIDRSDPEWYYEHRRELGKQAAKLIESGQTTVLTKRVLEARLKASKESKPVTIRLAVSDIQLAKEQAERLGLGYQTYLKSLLHQALTAK